MKLLSPVCCVCTLTIVLSGCQSVSAPKVQSSIQAGLSNLDFNLDSSSYVVRAGETLESIAFRYKTTPAQLLQLNPDAANGVYTGMHINIRPQPGTALASIDQDPSQIQSQAVPQTVPQTLPQAESLTPEIIQTQPIISEQAVPIQPLPNDDYLLSEKSFNRTSPAEDNLPTGQQSTGYVEQPGYPVEEVIEDDNFQLPGAVGEAQQAQAAYVEGWQWPIDGQLARDYDPQRPNGRGIEIIGMPGKEVLAARDGVVDWVARSPDGVGKVVIVRHDDDYLSIYSNAEDLYVAMNETVQQGEPIASLGANANDEPLLRFEISKGGDLLNPMDFLSPR